MQAIYYQGVPVMSFKQLDEMNGVPKGTSFRAFKRVREVLVEGRDYFYLPAASEIAFIEDLRQAGAIYPSTENLVLIAESGYVQMRGE